MLVVVSALFFSQEPSQLYFHETRRVNKENVLHIHWHLQFRQFGSIWDFRAINNNFARRLALYLVHTDQWKLCSTYSLLTRTVE